MHDRDALGPADLTDADLTRIVAARLGSDPVVTELLDSRVERVAYDAPAITTAARHWVRGTARTPQGARSWSLFCKHVQCWSRHELFAFVPPEARDLARAGVPWRTEPDVYRSELHDALPRGLTMPRASAVIDLDHRSAAVWLPELLVTDVTWDLPRYERAARLLGRFAARESVRVVAADVGHRSPPWSYFHGRLTHQVLPLLRDQAVWRHPLVAGAFDPGLQDGIRDAARRAEHLTAELATLPALASHGDASPHNLLEVDGVEEMVLIDFGFFGLMPVGFDLGQLLVGLPQTGGDASDLDERGERSLRAYVDGLRDEGDHTPLAVVRRAHALQLLLYVGLSAVPFELLGDPPSPRTHQLATARATIARHSLDLLASTDR